MLNVILIQPPEPVEPWQSELIANSVRGPCSEFNAIPTNIYVTNNDDGKTFGSEDCLYLNIYTPMNKSKLLPVIFWIYGGAFQTGGVNGFEQQYLIDQNIIFVSSNYRHGIFGFMSTEDEVVPGNMGLKDQSLALRWIHENIQQFGGDPNRIALVGLSSGAACVHYHYLSPMSAGLFNSGISLSGTALNPWAISRSLRERTMRVANFLRCDTSNTTEMVSCLKKQPVGNLITAQITLMVK